MHLCPGPAVPPEEWMAENPQIQFRLAIEATASLYKRTLIKASDALLKSSTFLYITGMCDEATQ